MTKFIFGGQEVEVPPLCLAAVRLAGKLLPPVVASKDQDQIFDVFLKIIACNLEDDDDPAKSHWTYHRLNRTIRGADEMQAILTGFWDLLGQSGFIKKGEPAPAGLTLGLEEDSGEAMGTASPPADPATSTTSSTISSSALPETDSKAEAGAP